MPPKSTLRKRQRNQAVRISAARRQKIEKAFSRPDITPDDAKRLLADADPADFQQWLEQVAELTTSRLALQERRKKSLQLALAYQALLRLNSFTSEERVTVVESLMRQLEALDRAGPPDRRGGKVKNADPTTVILKSLALYRVDDPSHRATLSKDKALLIFAKRQSIPSAEFESAIPRLRKEMSAAKSTRAKHATSAPAASTLNSSASRSAPFIDGSAEKAMSKSATAAEGRTTKVRGLKKLKHPGIYLALIEVHPDGDVGIRTPSRAFGETNRMKGMKKSDVKDVMSDATTVLTDFVNRRS